jgi:hypothetical protein
VNGVTKATLGLAAFVVVLGAVMWITTDRTYFAVVIVLGLLTGAGAWFTRPAAPSAGRPTPSSAEESE